MEDFKVLLVDDEEDFIKSLSERMQMRDVEHEVALDGQDALNKIQKDEPTVIVLDLKMPGMDGMEVLQRVKKAYPKTQVVILTGHGTPEARERAEKMGAYAYLEKPVEMDTLVETMKGAHTKWQRIKNSVDAALMTAAISATGELDLAQQVGREEMKDKD